MPFLDTNNNFIESLGQHEQEQEASTVLFVGKFFNPLGLDNVQLIKNGGLLVIDGEILFLCDLQTENLQDKLNDLEVAVDSIVLQRLEGFLIPGFVDTHVHAPQYPNAGTGMDLELLDWLEKYTFPTEAKFDDLQFAEKVYNKAVSRSLKNGTTTACYFGTIHTDASVLLAQICHDKGQRAFIGKVCMDRNSPEDYIEPSAEESLKETHRFVEEMESSFPDKLQQAIITPRFVPTCSTELMNGLGDLAASKKLHIQSHLSENKSEIEWVKSLHPDSDHYTAVYDESGLLTEKTVMAHCIHLEQSEIELLSERGVGVAFCPTSNFTLESGALNPWQLINAGIDVGLGTDVSGGYSTSILNTIRDASVACKVKRLESMDAWHNEIVAIEKDLGEEEAKLLLNNPPEFIRTMDFKELFFLATHGGAKALAIDHLVGSFEPGKRLDAIVINPSVNDSPFDVFESDDDWDIFQKALFLGDDRNVAQVFVDGKQISSC
eukprot:TRINITY_DN2547_c0_g1_i9.p1 TRINITY_DN2547_c0_g1~~TRINITY_DN2547_c0_g1_i9.p1  ORF type:complete len:492 (-),score=136.61 TRINITY_DN2547_c0_g1_i9:1295-2770(-)